jgi:hypothetical protein
LLAGAGFRDNQIAAKLRITPEKAPRSWNRFPDGGLAALDKDALRPGGTPMITPAKIKVIRRTTQEKLNNRLSRGIFHGVEERSSRLATTFDKRNDNASRLHRQASDVLERRDCFTMIVR